MGNKLEKQQPGKHLSDEMIDKGRNIGKVSMVLGMLQKEVAARRSSGNKVTQSDDDHKFFKPSMDYSAKTNEPNKPNVASAWAKFVNKG